MKAPDITYGFSKPKDVSGPTFEILSTTDAPSGSSTSLFSRLIGIDKDRVLVLSNVSVHAQPGAGQGVLIIRIQGQTATGVLFEIQIERFPGTAALAEVSNWQGEVYIIGGGPDQITVSVDVLFDAGAVTNFVEVNLHGIFIPRGNIAAF